MSVYRNMRTFAVCAAVATLAGVGVAVAAPAQHGDTPAAQPDTVSATGYNGYASRVDGTFGSGGTVSGVFAPARSFVRGSTTYVEGDVTLTLHRASGALLTGVTHHDVALPVQASGAGASPESAQPDAACPILHLVLGPLNLNLLGLTVHLNRVVLDITAHSGPGNLLGNLLCAVANLLNGTNPNLLDLLQLSNALNQIISILT